MWGEQPGCGAGVACRGQLCLCAEVPFSLWTGSAIFRRLFLRVLSFLPSFLPCPSYPKGKE